MAYKVFTDDTSFTAEDANNLQNQVVSIFVNAAERDNALPSPTPGQHVHLLSTKRTYYFDVLSGWVELMPGVVSGATARSLLVCTATTRPTQVAGRMIFETDTKNTYISDGVLWQKVASGDTGWQSVTSNPSSIDTKYRVVSGICYVTAIGTWSSWNAGASWATLPVGARPSSAAGVYGLSIYSDVAKEINVSAAGVLSVNKAGTVGIATTLSFPVA